MTSATNLTDWSAHIYWAAAETLAKIDEEATAERLLDELDADAAGASERRVTATLYVTDCSTYRDAYHAVCKRMEAVAMDAWQLIGIELRRFDLVDEELAKPAFPEVVGIVEAAEILGVSRQRAHVLADSRRFPEPLAHLATGPIFLAAAVRAFAEQPRSAGRPRKDVETIETGARAVRGLLATHGSKSMKTIADSSSSVSSQR